MLEGRVQASMISTISTALKKEPRFEESIDIIHGSQQATGTPQEPRNPEKVCPGDKIRACGKPPRTSDFQGSPKLNPLSPDGRQGLRKKNLGSSDASSNSKSGFRLTWAVRQQETRVTHERILTCRLPPPNIIIASRDTPPRPHRREEWRASKVIDGAPQQ